MKIQEVEQQVGITKKNIRFYEAQGLLSPGRDKENGYRNYSEAEVRTLQQIKLMRKLGLPLEEIRLMLSGQATVADSMRRHLVSLEREQANLQESMALCKHLQAEEGRLADLDVEAVQEEMDAMEQMGTLFSDKHRRDVKPLSYAAPLVVSLLTILLAGGFVGMLFWARKVQPDEAPPVLFFVVCCAAALLVVLGVILALAQRIGELKKGEAEDARNY